MTSAEPARRIEATDEEVNTWVERKREAFSSGQKIFTVENLEAYQMDEAETWKLIVAGIGCTVSWVGEDGSPGATYAKHASLDGAVHLLLCDGDEAIPALRRDPRVCVCFDGGDGVGAATIRGTVEFLDDPASLVRVLLATGRREGLSEEELADAVRSSTPGRDYILRVRPERYVTFTHEKIFRG